MRGEVWQPQIAKQNGAGVCWRRRCLTLFVTSNLQLLPLTAAAANTLDSFNGPVHCVFVFLCVRDKKGDLLTCTCLILINSFGLNSILHFILSLYRVGSSGQSNEFRISLADFLTNFTRLWINRVQANQIMIQGRIKVTITLILALRSIIWMPRIVLMKQSLNLNCSFMCWILYAWVFQSIPKKFK